MQPILVYVTIINNSTNLAIQNKYWYIHNNFTTYSIKTSRVLGAMSSTLPRHIPYEVPYKETFFFRIKKMASNKMENLQ